MQSQSKDEVVIELAKTFMDLLERDVPGWSRAFFRFEANDLMMGSNASYVVAANVTLLSALRNSDFFSHMNDLASTLRERTGSDGRKFCVMLLSVSASFDYKIDFEYVKPDRWRISKLDGASGLPLGVE